MATYVSDWSQEVYGDLRAHAVPGEPTAVRREYLNDYLQYELVLGNRRPAGDRGRTLVPRRRPTARSRTERGRGRPPGAGRWCPAEQMAAYLAAQVDALRFFSATTAQPRDHWGFAWAPRNTTGIPAADFAAQTGQLLDRLAAAIRDSAEATRPRDVGDRRVRAPGPGLPLPGRPPGCEPQRGVAVVPLVDAVDPRPSARAPPTLPAGTASPPLTVSVAASVRDAARGHVALELPAGHVLAEPARTVDDHADPERLTHRARHLLLPRHARRQSDADGVGARDHGRDADDLRSPPAPPRGCRSLLRRREIRARGTLRLIAASTDAFGNATTARCAGA